MKKPYPVIIDLSEKNVAIIGGGTVASRKIRKLNEIGVFPTVISPKLANEIDRGKIHWVDKPYSRDLVETMDILIVCTDDSDVNALVRSEATHFQLVNDTSDKYHSDFYNLATVTVDDVMVGISTGGKSPSRAKKIKNDLVSWLKNWQQKES